MTALTSAADSTKTTASGSFEANHLSEAQRARSLGVRETLSGSNDSSSAIQVIGEP